MPTKIVVLDGYTLNPGDLSWDKLKGLGPVTLYDRTPADQIVARSKGFSVALTNKVPFSAETLKQLPELKYIGVLATGYNIIDTTAAKQAGVVVTNVPTYGTDSVAQHAAALLLELIRQPARHSQAVHAGQWATAQDWCFALGPITELTDKTLGLVGLGRIGRAFARIGAALGMHLLGAEDPRPQTAHIEGLEIEFVEMDDLFRRSDAISLHCPLTPTTKHLVNERRLALMKKTAVLINTSRGPLVDEAALAGALKKGVIAGAALDVLEEEPPRANNPLIGLPNCIITPHISWYAREARQRLMDTAVENLRSFQAGKVVNQVN